MSGIILCFGEVLMRLSAPGGGLIMQRHELECFFGGAEANVAVSIAQLGGRSRLASRLPDNPLGDAALRELRGHGVDVSLIDRAPGRLGLYFMTPGAMMRPADVIYDRKESTFARMDPRALDWDVALDGASWLHLSGVTPAVGANAAAAALVAVEAATARGVPVSFDSNYRAKMWADWDGDAPAILKEIVSHASLWFADHRDVGLLLGQGVAGHDHYERRRLAAQRAFEAFPRLQRMTSTIRLQHSVDHQELSAMMISRQGEAIAPSRHLTGIVDRIGGGDAYAAGVLHRLSEGADDRDAIGFGLAAACLKHAIPGDFNLSGLSDVEALLSGESGDVRR